MNVGRKIGTMLVSMLIIFITLPIIAHLMPYAEGREIRQEDVLPSELKKVDVVEDDLFMAQSVSSLTLQAPVVPALTSAIHTKDTDKIIYLTFDDGPSKHTDEVLKILEEAGVPATFFILGKQAERYPEVVNRIYEAGHAIGNHTYDHNYETLYSSFGAFWAQIKETEEILRQITGERTTLVRAPGGTYGHFDSNYFKWLELGGYRVFDWNVDSGDSRRKSVPAAEIVRNSTSVRKGKLVHLLLHDGTGHEETVKALPEIIDFYQQQGYEFRALTADTPVVQFSIAPSMKGINRPMPSEAWLSVHVKPNAALFSNGKPLVIEAGALQTKLNQGEYDLQGNHYYVPLRAVMERLGAQVKWEEDEQTAVIYFADRRIQVSLTSANAAIVTSRSVDKGIVYYERIVSSERRGGLIWLPLHTLLEATGLKVVSFAHGEEEHQVKAMKLDCGMLY